MLFFIAPTAVAFQAISLRLVHTLAEGIENGVARQYSASGWLRKRKGEKTVVFQNAVGVADLNKLHCSYAEKSSEII